MPKRPKTVPDKINPNRVQSRDHLLTRLINGATKSGYHRDKKREANKHECRKKLKVNETE